MDEEELIRDTNIIHRFSDVGGEPCIILPPIERFQNNILVSLEEAVEPLIPIVKDIAKKVSMAKDRAKNPSDDLTSDQSAAITLYTMESEPYTSSVFYILNSALRSEARDQLKPWLLYLKLILTALSHLHSIHATVYRGLKLDTKIEYERYQEGKDVYWWGFSSCTTNKNISEQEYFLNSTGTRTLFIIECSHGKYIGSHSYNRNDQEILLLPGTRFEVVRCDRRRDDLHKIYMKEVKTQSAFPKALFTTSVHETVEDSSSSMHTPSMRRKLIPKFWHQSFNNMFKH
jgi:hypothetical protein